MLQVHPQGLEELAGAPGVVVDEWCEESISCFTRPAASGGGDDRTQAESGCLLWPVDALHEVERVHHREAQLVEAGRGPAEQPLGYRAVFVARKLRKRHQAVPELRDPYRVERVVQRHPELPRRRRELSAHVSDEQGGLGAAVEAERLEGPRDIGAVRFLPGLAHVHEEFDLLVAARVDDHCAVELQRDDRCSRSEQECQRSFTVVLSNGEMAGIVETHREGDIEHSRPWLLADTHRPRHDGGVLGDDGPIAVIHNQWGLHCVEHCGEQGDDFGALVREPGTLVGEAPAAIHDLEAFGLQHALNVPVHLGRNCRGHFQQGNVVRGACREQALGGEPGEPSRSRTRWPRREPRRGAPRTRPRCAVH